MSFTYKKSYDLIYTTCLIYFDLSEWHLLYILKILDNISDGFFISLLI